MIAHLYREAALATLLFFASLSSWYFYSLGINPMPLLSFAGLAAWVAWIVRHEGVRVPDALILTGSFAVVLVAVLLQLVTDSLPFNTGRLLGIVTFISTIALASSLLRAECMRGINLKHVLAVVLLIHVAAVAFQVLYFLASRQYFDFLFGLTGEWQRVYGSKGLSIGIYRLPRFAGLFNEPGTYSANILPLVFLYRLLKEKPDVIYLAGLFSVLLTMSAFGMAGVVALFLYEVVTLVSRRTLSVSLLLIGTAVLAAAFILLPAYESRFSGSNVGSLEIRASGLTAFASLDYLEYLAGRGPAADTRDCEDCIGLYMGSGLTYIYYSGLLNYLFVFLVFPLLPYLGRMTSGKVLTFIFLVGLLSMLKIKVVYPWLGWMLAMGAFITLGNRSETPAWSAKEAVRQ